MTNILDPKFRYTPSHKTDIRKTLRREQRRLARLAEREAQRDAENQAEAARVVRPMARRKP
jgi:hypothetical protein